jgi:hypothetical protein
VVVNAVNNYIMVASKDEAANIAAIILKYVPITVAQNMMIEIQTKVGNHSDNESLRETIKLLKYYMNLG